MLANTILSTTQPGGPNGRSGHVGSAYLPVVREIPADLETPVSVYMKLMGHGPSFLLESVTGGEQVARFSFIGVGPSRAFILRKGRLECFSADGPSGELYPTLEQDCQALDVTDPLAALRNELIRFHRPALAGLPRFSGGLVGYLSYEMMRYFEPTVPLTPHPDLPDAVFLLADTLAAFDHAFGRLLLIANLRLEEGASKLVEQRAREEAEARLDALQERLVAPPDPRVQRFFTSVRMTDSSMKTKNVSPGMNDISPEMNGAARGVTETALKMMGEVMEKNPGRPLMVSNMSREQFMQAVNQAKEHIAAGDIFQVVLSQQLSRETDAEPFQIYRALRRLNPSPYMFYFDFDTLAGEPPLRMIGASPEVHVRLEGRTASLRPIAGTRPRGQTPVEDAELEQELLADPKERAEHVMLVDLGRNDLGRVCEYGSVHVPELMAVERYSHVMHIVSQVEGRLRAEYDAFDLLRATFPAGTVSGAPKIRAMQIIDDLEGTARGPYAGAVGYISYDGALDTCITIRTLTMRGRKVTVQAGAGIVADSDPEREYQETLNKARAIASALNTAEEA